ncbi:fatty aldehyde dehydrogenase, partial [Lipomyces japonicus]|uniref:fatty aldehyde dehydrogenase n=1 Tax=Lipomyces japonicus TaxID=56871 RepID=UPI0034CFAA8E
MAKSVAEFATPVSEISQIYSDVTNTFRSHKTLPLEFRLDQLRKLYYGLTDNYELIAAATKSDLHKPDSETLITEYGFVIGEIVTAIKNLTAWAKDEVRSSDLIFHSMKPTVRKAPFGTALIIATWNYPLMLSVPPLVGAIAAGNTAILKLSEISPASGQIIAKIINESLDSTAYRAVNGEANVTTELLQQKFDIIFFTGSSRIGRIVSEAAAKTLTPVILELGGKSPAFVLDNSNLKLAAQRLAYAKFTNAGQTCVAPDYILLKRGLEDEFLKAFANSIDILYKDLTSTSDDYGHIVNNGNFNRLIQIINDSKGKVVIGGTQSADEKTLFIEPTVILDVKPDDSTMKDELFGPVLPIVLIDSVNDGINYVSEHHDTPLALYIFSKDKEVQNRVLDHTRSGGAMINGALIHVGVPFVPFGGVGQSGTGRYHGKDSFDAFSHHRAVITEPYWTEILTNLRYPPYSESKKNLYKKVVLKKAFFPRVGTVPTSLLQRITAGVKSWYVVLIVTALAASIAWGASRRENFLHVLCHRKFLTEFVSRFTSIF